MFNRNWRMYPWGMQLLLLMLMVFTFMSFTTFLVLSVLPRATGITYKELVQTTAALPAGKIRIAVLAQALAQIGTFMVPALLFAAMVHPKVRDYLNLRAPGKWIHWLLVTGIMLGFLPVTMWGEAWMMKHLQLGGWAQKAQAANDATFQAFLSLRSPGDIAFLLFSIALLPAIGEELFFRGEVLRLFHRGVNRFARPVVDASGKIIEPDVQRTMLIPTLISAIFFALWHSNPYGFVFIFFAGILLANIYSLTGSLLCNMWAHFLFNGSQILLYVFSQSNASVSKVVGGDEINPAFPIAGLFVFAICFYGLVKLQTPLPLKWSDDFADEPEFRLEGD